MDEFIADAIKLFLVVLLVLLNGFFVAAEFAVVKIRSSRIETLINEGTTRAHYAKKLTDHLDVSLSVTQLGITLASLGLGWLGEPTVSRLLEPVFEYLGLGGALATTISFAIAFALITADTKEYCHSEGGKRYADHCHASFVFPENHVSISVAVKSRS